VANFLAGNQGERETRKEALMATAVLFIGWNRPLPGIDPKKAYGHLLTEGIPYLRKLEGKVFERIETVGLTAHGGNVNGFVLLFGERIKLDELRRTNDFEAFVMKLDELFDGLTVVPGVNWEGIQAVMKRYSQDKG
jgi:hypothetical protein